VFTQFSGQPQCFLTGEQLIEEMRRVGFVADPAVPMTEYNQRQGTDLRLGGPPVILEAVFRFSGARA